MRQYSAAAPSFGPQTNDDMTICIVGCGNMGLAFARAFRQYDLVRADDQLLIVRRPERAEALATERIGHVRVGIGPEVGAYDLVIVAVKPQDFGAIAGPLREVLRPGQLVLSVMAGLTIARLQEQLGGHRLIVRAMPNTPATLGMGITGFAAAPEIDFASLRKVDNLINATGRSLFLEDETMLDAVTALSGSGPAYFYYLVKAMIEAGRQMGFDDATAGLLVKQTMLGAFHLINGTDRSLDELIRAVASRGGTTEAALRTFEAGGLADVLISGIRAAQQRAAELGAAG